jgi:hypothetical protein
MIAPVGDDDDIVDVGFTSSIPSSQLGANIIIGGGGEDHIISSNAQFSILAGDYVNVILPLWGGIFPLAPDHITPTTTAITGDVGGYNDLIESTSAVDGTSIIMGNDGDDFIRHVGYGGSTSIYGDSCDSRIFFLPYCSSPLGTGS